MALQSAAVTVAATATVLSTAAGDREGHRVLILNPSGGVTVYVGGADVSTANGYPVASGGTLSLALEVGEIVYGIVATGTQAVNVLRSGRP